MNRKIIYLIFAFLLLFFCFIALQVGSYLINFSEIVDSFCHFFAKQEFSPTDKIILNIRLPRIVLSIFAGVVIACSGVVYQTLLRNPLAEPFTLGVSSGAVLGVAIAVSFSQIFTRHFSTVPFAFVGGFLTLLILFILVVVKNVSLYTLIFLGIAISYFCNALLTLIMSLLGDKSSEILNWSFGSFANIPDLFTFILYIVVCVIVVCYLVYNNKILDMFYLPDEIIQTSGINIKVARVSLLLVASVGTIFSVSLCGVIGFVGLVVPHIARLLLGAHHKQLLIGSILIGALLMLVSDTLARTIISFSTNYGKELPVGVVTSLIGVPFFVILLFNKRKN